MHRLLLAGDTLVAKFVACICLFDVECISAPGREIHTSIYFEIMLNAINAGPAALLQQHVLCTGVQKPLVDHGTAQHLNQ
jgi:hypothetical protein